MEIFADETTVAVLDPGRGRTKSRQLCAYARDDLLFIIGTVMAAAIRSEMLPILR